MGFPVSHQGHLKVRRWRTRRREGSEDREGKADGGAVDSLSSPFVSLRDIRSLRVFAFSPDNQIALGVQLRRQELQMPHRTYLYRSQRRICPLPRLPA